MKSLIFLSIILSTALACNNSFHETNPARLAAEKLQGFTTLTKEHLKSRQLSRETGTWRSLDIHFDMTAINKSLKENNMEDRIPFYAKVFKATGAWWQDAVKINDDRSEILKTITAAQNGEDGYMFVMNMGGKSIADYDLFVSVKWANEVGNTSTLAYAGPSLRHPVSQRPIFGEVFIEAFGDKLFRNPTKGLNEAMSTTIHEFGHIIAFIQWDQYQSNNLISDGAGKKLWNGPKVLAKAREFWDCPTYQGAPLQMTKSGYTGGHWSEEDFGTEAMSPEGGSTPESFSAMTLALCEDSGWYQSNYGMVENYTFNKGTGCSSKSCAHQKCTPSSAGVISVDKQSMSKC